MGEMTQAIEPARSGPARLVSGDSPTDRGSALRGLVLVLAAVMVGACTGIQEPSEPVAVLELTRQVTIPAGRARAVFRGGRQVSAANDLEPYCELEINTVSEQPQRAIPGAYRVKRVRIALLKDPVTRVPALISGWSCADPVFRETVWLLGKVNEGNLHSLRCIRPLYHCQMAPPLTVGDAERLTGGVIRVGAQRTPVHSP
jgi:hypothetical protein